MSGTLKVAPPETGLPSASGAAGGNAATSTTGDGNVASPSSLRLPTGLKNLGATCYLNSQLQALFANKSFRQGVFSWRPSAGAGAGVGAAGASTIGVDGTMDSEGGSSGGGGGAASETEAASSDLDDAIMRVSADKK